MESIEKNEQVEKIQPKGILAGGPGIGKSTLTEKLSSNIKVVDVEPTPYTNDATWPQNYIEEIVRNTGNFDLLLISTQPEVVQALIEKGFEVTVVCPDESLKNEYEDRFRERGHDEALVQRLVEKSLRTNEENRNNFDGGKIIFLQSGQYLKDILDLES